MKSIYINKSKRRFLSTQLIVALVAINLVAVSQTPVAKQQNPIAITGATIHTMVGDPIENGTVIFDKGKIIAVGSGIEIPEATEVINADGKHIYPGLIHARSGAGLMEISRIAEGNDMSEEGNINPNLRLQVAFNSVSEHLPAAAVSGVTTVVPSPTSGTIAGITSAMFTDGWTWEQMTMKEGIGMVANWPSTRNAKEYTKQVDELQNAIDQARRYMQARQAMENGKTIIHHPFNIRWEAIIPVLKGELPMFIAASNIQEIQAAIAWARRENIKMVLVGNRDIGLLAPQLAQMQIPVIVAGSIGGPTRQWDSYSEGYTTPLHLYNAGVEFCIAGDAFAPYVYRIHHHAAAAAAFGLPINEALKSITINAARILGIDDTVGSIEVGKDASLMITNGNPLELSSSREQVFIQGRKIDMTDKHKRLYERYLEKHLQSER
jgi:imidazolonepropionase-like amidohydrolase